MKYKLSSAFDKLLEKLCGKKSDSSLLLTSYEFRRKVRHKQVLFKKEIVRKYIDLQVALGVVTQSVTISRNYKQDCDFAAN